MNGIIALDIDGTITDSATAISPRVVAYLSMLVDEGWQLCFITGRTHTFSLRLLRQLPFPYFLAAYNGAVIVRMPSEEVLARRYLTPDVLPHIENLSSVTGHDGVIYGGFEDGDNCYYRPHRFNVELLDYAQMRQKRKGEVWTGVTTFEEIDLQAFPSVKFFGRLEALQPLCLQIEEHLGLHAPLCIDSLLGGWAIAQITHALANKGAALRWLGQLCSAKVLIAAGNDGNDLSMLEVADIRVVIEDAPSHVLSVADIVAPIAAHEGIIEGLSRAIEAVKRE